MHNVFPLAHFSSINAIKFNFPSFIKKIIDITFSEKIQQLALIQLKSISSLYLCAFGSSELFQSILLKNSSERIQSVALKTFESSKSYLNLHGGLLAGSGIFSLMDALHDFGILHGSNLGNLMCHAGSVLFLCANIIALEENLRLFNVLNETDAKKNFNDDNELQCRKKAIFWGILSNIGYILATGALLFNGLSVITLLMVIFSCFAGGIKIIYDLSIWAKTHQITEV